MENASKALIMAASVLLGVMLLSIAAVLFQTFSDFGSNIAGKVDEKQLAEWNNKYLKYYGQNTVIKDNGKETTEPIKVSAHDIISVVNSARENNLLYFENDTSKWSQYQGKENYYYVQVIIKNVSNNAEVWDSDKKNEFLQEKSLITKSDGKKEPKYFECTECKISKVTKRVYKISFKEL